MDSRIGRRRLALVIEDEPLIARVCRRTLELEEFDVDLAGNGKIAARMADQQTYDLYVADIRTPDMNGIAFYRHIEKRHPEVAGRVIFTTGDILSGEVRSFLQEANPGFLPKPFTPSELRKVVRTTIGTGVI